MPEGDTVYQAARRLDAALTGQLVSRTDLRVPAFATVDLSGETMHSVASRGKHLLMRIGDAVLHTHLKMEGEWRVHRPGEKWRRPAWQARAIVETRAAVAVGFDLGLVEVFPAAEEADRMAYLGPDLLGGDWDAAEAVRRIEAAPEVPIAVALGDQRNLAGLGNVYVNELCFLRGIRPTRPAGEVEAVPLVDLAARVIRANRDRIARTTTGEHGLLGRNDIELRESWWCPNCQR
jgi:endonuclease VIII